MWNYIQGVKNPAENVERKAERKEYFEDYERKRAGNLTEMNGQSALVC